MKKILFFILLLWSFVSIGQTKGYFRYDTIVFEKNPGNAEFILKNATRGVTGGVLTNMGNGRGAWVTPSGGSSTLTKLGTGFPIGITGTNNVRSVAGSNTISLDSSTSNTVTFNGDTSYLATKADINHPFLGYRYNDSASAVTGDFINVGASYLVTGGNIVFTSGGDNDGTKYLYSGGATCQEQWIGTIGFKVTSKNGTSYGPYIGIHSINTVGAISTGVQFDMTTGAGSGKASLLLGAAYGVQGSTSALTFSVGDSIEVTIERNVSVLTVNAKNITTGSVATPFIYDYKFTDGVYIHNTGYFALEQRSDSFSVYKLQYFSKAVKNPDWVVAGDSKAMGYFANTFWDSYSGKMKFAFNNTVVLAGPGDMIQDLAKRLQEIIDLHPTKGVLLAMVSNSMRNGESGYVARYDSCVTVLEAAGVPCYHLEPIPETGGLDQSSFVTHLRSTYPAARIIYVYDEFKENAAGYIYSDNVHPNQAGHDFIFNKILESGKLTGAKTIIKDDLYVKGQDAYDQPVPFRISGTGTMAKSVSGTGIAGNHPATFLMASNQILDFYNSVTYNQMVSSNSAGTNGSALRFYASQYSFDNFNPGTTQWLATNTSADVFLPSTTRLSDTTGYDILARKRTDGQLKMIYSDLIGGGGAGSGTVTNVATGLGLSGGPITTTGTIIADTSYLVNKSTTQIISGFKNFTGGVYANTSSAADPITGNAIFKAADANGMTLSFRDHATGQGYLAISNGTMTGYLGHTNTTQGITFGSYTGHAVTIVQANAPGLTFNTAKQIGVYTVTSPTAFLHLPGGGTSAGYAPLKIDAGTITTPEAGAIERPDAFTMTKTNNVRYGVGGTLNSQFTDVGNVGAGEDDLMAYTVPAGTLSTNGDFLEFTMDFQFFTGNSKTLKLYFGSQLLFSSGTATPVAFVSVKGTITRTGAATQRCFISFVTSSTTWAYNSELSSPTETLSGAVVLKATGTATADNDIVQKLMTVKFFPNN